LGYGSAPHVTATAIESHSERIVGIQHAHKIDSGKINKGSLTKYCTPQLLEKTMAKLENISHIVTDCSSSMNQFVKQALNNTNRHRNIIHSKDIWHVSKNIPNRWYSFLNKMKKEAHKKQFDIKVLNELEDLNTTKLKTHYWYWATQKLDPIQFKNQLCNATNYWTTRIGLSKEQAEVINQFFLMLVGDEPAQQHSDGLSSALCESLHSVNNKYCPKGWNSTVTVFMKQGKILLYWIGTIEKRMFLQTNGKET